jgi:multidrug efflux pump subunit AcrB
MITSYLMAQTLVPVLSNWLMKEHHPSDKKQNAPAGSHLKNRTPDDLAFIESGISKESEQDTWQQRDKLISKHQKKRKKISGFDKFKLLYGRQMNRFMPFRRIIVWVYIAGGLGIAWLLLNRIGRDVLPKSNVSQFQVRMRDEDGTRIEKTEKDVLRALEVLNEMVGKENISITSAMVGMHGSTFSTNPIYLFMAGPQEAVLQVALKEGYKTNMDELKDRFREKIKEALPNVKLSFEPIELTDKILSQGSPTPIEVKIIGKDKKQNEQFAYKIIDKLSQISYLRDVQLGQAIHYPSINVNIDRVRAAQLGTNVNDIARSIVAATSSSRFTEKNIWLDQKISLGYNVQVEVPENEMTSIQDVSEIPVNPDQARPVLGDVATISLDSMYGEDDNIGAVPVLSVTANIYKKDLGTATRDVNRSIESLGTLPRGLTVETRGLTQVLTETLDSLQSGLIVAIVVIFLMLAANFQSFKVSLVVLCTVPAVLVGSLGLLILTDSTLNLQSYMGIIMSVGVSISNSVLLVTNAEEMRVKNGNALLSARQAASVRIRPIIMTSLAMVVGMIPMASGLGEGGDQSAPLGRAVIGGLIASTFAALLILPMVFAWVQQKTGIQSVSLDPEDPGSIHYIASLYGEKETKEGPAGN